MTKLLADLYDPIFVISDPFGHLMLHVVSDWVERVNSAVRPEPFNSGKTSSGQRTPLEWSASPRAQLQCSSITGRQCKLAPAREF